LLQPPAQEGMVFSENETDMPLSVPDHENIAPKSAAGWTPGFDCGAYVGTVGAACLQEQSQVLIGNVVSNLTLMSKSTSKQLLSEVRPAMKLGYNKVALPVFAASKLLGLGAHTVSNVWSRLQARNWRPETKWGGARSKPEPEPGSETAPGQDSHNDCEAKEAVADKKTLAMRHVVTLAISCAVEGQSGLAYERQACRWQLAGVDVGTGLHSRRFFRDTLHVASLVLSQLEGLQWSLSLPGTGTPSDFALMVDPVSLGTGFAGRHETVLMMSIMVVNGATHKLCTPMLAAPTLGIGDHGGDKLVELCLQALAEHPALFDMASLRARLSLVGGDGGIVRGGRLHRHQSTGAAEKLWARVHSDAEEPVLHCVDWDQFHRDDVGFSRAVRSSKAATELLSLAKDLDHLFNYGDGRIIFRSLSKELNEPAGQVRTAGGTRKAGALVSIPENILHHLKRLVVGLRARHTWRNGGHGNYSLEQLSNISRRLLDPAFLTFTMLCNDLMMGPVRQHILIVQGAVEPWSCREADMAYVEQLQSMLRGYELVEQLVNVTTLLAQHCSVKERA
jgi:hypothetical protein